MRLFSLDKTDLEVQEIISTLTVLRPIDDAVLKKENYGSLKQLQILVIDTTNIIGMFTIENTLLEYNYEKYVDFLNEANEGSYNLIDCFNDPYLFVEKLKIMYNELEIEEILQKISIQLKEYSGYHQVEKFLYYTNKYLWLV